MLLVKHSNLVIDFGYVLKLVRIDPLGCSLPTEDVLHLRLPGSDLIRSCAIAITFLVC